HPAFAVPSSTIGGKTVLKPGIHSSTIGGKIALKLGIRSSTIGGKIALKLGIRSSTIGSRIVLKLGASFPIGSSTTGLTLCSSATSAFHRGGVGALGGVGATRTDTTATTVPVMDTARAVGREWLIYRAGSLAPAITTALSTESWDRRLGERYAPTSGTVDTRANLVSSR